jgi:DNA-binding response OmpR family regulator
MANIIFVDDDEKLVDSLMQWLRHENFTVDAVYLGKDALQMLKMNEYDIVILDRNLPDMEGLDICRSYRAIGGQAPVLMLTGKGSISDKEEGLEGGADDYLTKPFHPRELVARLRALMRRPRAMQATVLEAGGVKLDVTNRIVTKNGQQVHLTPIEFSLLEFFMKNPRQLFSADILLHRVWGDSEEGSIDAIYTCIRRLRQKLDTKKEPSIIRTVHGVGYGLEL